MNIEIRIHRPLDEVFPFFSDPWNLERITPPWLRFRVEAVSTDPIEAGTEIDYRLRLRGIPMRWRSRITLWEPPHRFVDEQVSGPYRLWRHVHSFEARGDATLARDRVEYAVFGGSLVRSLLVDPDLERIFAYRSRALTEILEGDRGTRALDMTVRDALRRRDPVPPGLRDDPWASPSMDVGTVRAGRTKLTGPPPSAEAPGSPGIQER